MLFRGREVDVVSLWSEFVDLPADAERHVGSYMPKVKCPNPGHHTSKRHFQINTAKPLVHCFANCGISGTWEHAISIIRGCDEREARRTVLRHTRVPIGGIKSTQSFSGTRKRLDGPDEIAADMRALNARRFAFLPRAARDYLSSRGLDEHAILKWGIGWDDETDRIVIPAFDNRQSFKFLIRRSIDGAEPKYLYTAGAIKTSILFGECFLDRTVLRSHGLVLVEGSVDTVCMHGHGLGNTVGTLGTYLSTKQVRLIDRLRPRRIYCLFDRDTAGVVNIKDVNAKLAKYPLFVCRYPGEREDPAELTRKEAWAAIERAIPMAQFNRNVKALTRR